MTARISHCENKPNRFMFDFGIIDTTGSDCEQQVPTVALCLQQLITHSVYNR